MGFPLFVENKVIGVFSLASRTRHFSKADFANTQELVAHVALLLHSAQLFHEPTTLTGPRMSFWRISLMSCAIPFRRLSAGRRC